MTFRFLFACILFVSYSLKLQHDIFQDWISYGYGVTMTAPPEVLKVAPLEKSNTL